MCDEKVRAASQQDRVRVLIQILSDQLKRRELLGGKGQLQSFGDITSLQWEKLRKKNKTPNFFLKTHQH